MTEIGQVGHYLLALQQAKCMILFTILHQIQKHAKNMWVRSVEDHCRQQCCVLFLREATLPSAQPRTESPALVSNNPPHHLSPSLSPSLPYSVLFRWHPTCIYVLLWERWLSTSNNLAMQSAVWAPWQLWSNRGEPHNGQRSFTSTMFAKSTSCQKHIWDDTTSPFSILHIYIATELQSRTCIWRKFSAFIKRFLNLATSSSQL